MTKTRLFLLTVRAADGSVVRRREYRTCEDVGLSDAVPTLEELLAGYHGEVRSPRGSVCWNFEPVNPKVLPLVQAMLAAGIVTTGSGDMYGSDLIYVDLADGWEGAAAAARVPPGWVITPRRSVMVREALELPPETYNFPGEPVEGVQGDEDEAPGPAVRLSRRGGAVAPQETMAIINSLLRAARRTHKKR